MNLDLFKMLKIYCAVIEQGTLTAAAHTLGVSSSHVSRQLDALEEELGVRLMQRTTRQLGVTDAGRRYYARVAPLLDELEAASERIVAEDASPTGRLRVAVPVSFAQEHALAWFAEFGELYPGIRIELELSHTPSDLIEERIDVALRMGKLEASSLMAMKLCAMPRIIVASPGYLATHGDITDPEQLSVHAALVFPFGVAPHTWRLRDGQRQEWEITLDERFVIPEGMMLRELAVQGRGLTMLPEWMLYRQLDTGELVRLFELYDVTATHYDTSIWLVYPARDYLPARTRLFIDFIKQKFVDGPPWAKLLR